MRMQIGVVSDTHGLLRPEVLPLLAGAEHIFHLGDVGDPEILGLLSSIAPVTAIRGNIDTQGPCARLPETEGMWGVREHYGSGYGRYTTGGIPEA